MYRRYLFLILLLLQACTPDPDMSLRIGSNQWPGYEPLYLAHTLGLHDNNQLKLIELTSATEVMNAFRLGQLDIAALTMDEVLQLADTDTDLVIFLVMDISNGADKLVASPNVGSLAELKHKRIGVENTALGAYFLSCIMETSKLSREELTIVPGTIDQHHAMLTSGQVDAIVTFDPVASQLLAQGFHTLFDSSQISGKIVDVLVTRRSLLQQKRTSFEQLLQAHWQALAYLKQQPETAVQLMAPRLHLSTAQLTQSFAELILPDVALNKSLLDTTLVETANLLNSVMLKQGMMQRNIDANLLISDEMLP